MFDNFSCIVFNFTDFETFDFRIRSDQSGGEDLLNSKLKFLLKKNKFSGWRFHSSIDMKHKRRQFPCLKQNKKKIQRYEKVLIDWKELLNPSMALCAVLA